MNKLKLHSIYLTGNKSNVIPEKILSNIESFKRCYPDFDHHIYTDDSLYKFIQDNYDSDVLWAYTQLIPLAYKADLGRYCLLYKLGGIYADVSITFFHRIWLDEFPGKKILFFRDAFSHAPWIISNSILMAEPKQFLFKYLIDKIVEHVKTGYYGFNPLCPTGPNLVGRAAAQLLDMKDFLAGEVVKINRNPNTWSYAYIVPMGEVLAVNIKIGNGLSSLGAAYAENYNDYWNLKKIYKKATDSELSAVNNKIFDDSVWRMSFLAQSLTDVENRARKFEVELSAVLNSTSWRITEPLRKYNPRRFIKYFIAVVKNKIFACHEIFAAIKNKIKINPWVYRLIKKYKFIGGKFPYENLTFEDVCFENVTVQFAHGPLADLRGIGRVSRELLNEFKKYQFKSSSSQLSKNNRSVYFYSSIHWCPTMLPHPCVVMVHDVIPLILPELFPAVIVDEWRNKFLKIAQQADRIVTISHSSARDIALHLSIPSERISVIYNGVTSLDFGIDFKIPLPPAPFVVFAGSHDQHKNIDVVLKALSHEIVEEVHMVLVGDNHACMSKVMELGLIDRIHFLGRLNDQDLSGVISRAVALVFPSLYEGFGLPPLEAALLGTPSICSDRPAMNELLAGVAILVDPNSEEEWASAIKNLKDNTQIRAQLAVNALSRAQKFTWGESAKKYIEIFESIAL